jgi:hypothetical protein
MMSQATNLGEPNHFGARYVANDNEYANRRITDLSCIYIRDDFLKMAVGIKLESGVSDSEIRSVIGEFVFEQQARTLNMEIFAYQWVEHLPQERRNAFLTALAALSPRADDTPTEPGVISAELTNATHSSPT